MSYYKNRINFEVFHALTDGTGAMHFLMELVKDYLQEHIRRKNFRSFFQTKISPEEIWKRTVFPSIIPQMRQERESPRSRLSAER